MPHYPTFRAELNYQDEITADEITVIFNGTTYTVPKDPNGLYGLGTLMDRGTVTGDYPFCIARESGTNYVYVNEDVYDNHNPFAIKIIENLVTTTECFEKAVRSATSPLIVEATLSPGEATTQSPSYLQAPAEKIAEAMTTRGVVVRDPYGNLYSALFATNLSVTIAMGMYNSTTRQTDFSAFCYTISANGLRYPPDAIA